MNNYANKQSPERDTIAAVSTALRPAAISVIRVSGGRAAEIADTLFTSVSGKKPSDFTPRKLYAGRLSGGGVTDEAMCVYFPARASFTGEDSVEFHCHGGVALTLAVLELIKAAGARQAEAGEFTRRAFLSGRLDLAKAEGIADLINAESAAELRAGAALLDGKLSELCRSALERTANLLAEIDASVDFPDEYDGENLRGRGTAELLALAGELRRAAATYAEGRLIKDGITCVLAGPVNAGKSSLMNALCRRDRAIVTDIPGTTRDVLTETIVYKGLKINLADTAGLRDARDEVEGLGIERAKREIRSADVVLHVTDVLGSAAPPPPEFSGRLLNIKNKADTLPGMTAEECERLSSAPDAPHYLVSAKLGWGLTALLDSILAAADAGDIFEGGLILTNARHSEALARAAEELDKARAAFADPLIPLDAAYIDIKSAYTSLGTVTGDTASEDVIDALFSNFCVGK